MNIVQVMPEFSLAGAEIMCENLIYELVKLGHKVTVISMYDYHSAITERIENSGIDIRYLGKKSGIDFSMILKMKKIFKEVKADVVHTHRYCAQYAMPAAILIGVEHKVHTVHNVAEKENKKSARFFNKFFFKHCKLIPVALSKRIRDSIVREYKIKSSDIPIVLNGIDLTKCIQKKDYSINGNFKILHIGRFSEQKNHLRLAEAFNDFNSKYPDSELWLIGDGEKKPEIEKYVKDNNLTSKVKFLGLQSDVYTFLHDADIFTLPSNYEGIPMTLIEAMGTGLPIVATAVGGVPDMLNKNNSQIVSPDKKAIENAFENYYLDKSLRELHGVKALKSSFEFSSTAMAIKYLGIYSGELND